MNTINLQKQFGRMGARLEFTSKSERFNVNISRDKRGPFFDITLDSDRWEPIILDLQPEQRHLLLLIRDQTNDDATKSKYLCGHDERDWFIAAVPEASGASNVRSAMEALKPAEVLAAQTRKNVKMRNRNRRRNEAFIRQGEWFFLPETNINPPKWMILSDEPLIRGSGKPHTAETLYRTGGTTVYVNRQYPNGLSEENYRRLVQEDKAKAGDFRVQRLNPKVYVKGRITHSDHKTVILNDWHRVVPNTEHLAVSMSHLAFID